MSLSQLFQSKRVLSFELFPPKTAKGEANLMAHVEQLMQFGPDFITCTYGAGGSTQDKTLEIVRHVKQNFQVPVASHLTVVGSSVDQLRSYLQRAQDMEVDYIVALRGDPPQGTDTFVPADNGLAYANELVSLINQEFPGFEMLVAGYPEKHQEAVSLDVDLDNLKRKVDAGATAVVTQLFYNNDDFYRFRDKCRQRQIEVPLVPGLLPITNLGQIRRITQLCGATLPAGLVSDLEQNSAAEAQFEIGVQQCVEQTQELIAEGVDGLHYYVLNQSAATKRILEAVDLKRTKVPGA